jgi:hypothetical protein
MIVIILFFNKSCELNTIHQNPNTLYKATDSVTIAFVERIDAPEI